MNTCLFCGNTILEGSQFCMECGRPVQQAAVDEQSVNITPQASACSNCGAELTEGAVFCMGCGQPVQGGGQSVQGGDAGAVGVGAVGVDAPAAGAGAGAGAADAAAAGAGADVGVGAGVVGADAADAGVVGAGVDADAVGMPGQPGMYDPSLVQAQPQYAPGAAPVYQAQPGQPPQYAQGAPVYQVQPGQPPQYAQGAPVYQAQPGQQPPQYVQGAPAYQAQPGQQPPPMAQPFYPGVPGAPIPGGPQVPGGPQAQGMPAPGVPIGPQAPGGPQIPGAPQAAQPEGAKEEKPFYKRPPVLILAAVALVVIIAAVGFLVTIAGMNKVIPSSNMMDFSVNSGFVSYIKDGELKIAGIKSLDSFQASTDLFPNRSSRSSTQLGQGYDPRQIQITRNGSRLFYPDRFDSGSYNLNTRTVSGGGGNSGEPLRLDTDVRGLYRTSEDGKHAYYIKGDTRTLYWHNLKDRTRIASEVQDFIINKNGTRLYYINREDSLFVWTRGASAPERIDSEAQLVGASPDLSTVYYIKFGSDSRSDGTLYRKKVNGERERIAGAVRDVIRLYDSGVMYYSKEADSEDGRSIEVLHYFDGTNETKLGGGHSYQYAMSSSDLDAKRPALIYSVRTKDGDIEYRVAVKSIDLVIDVSKTFEQPMVNHDGTKMYFIDDYNDSRQTGDLWAADIADDGKKQASQIHDDVHAYGLTKKGGVFYVTQVSRNGNVAELYRDGNLVDTEVYLYERVTEIVDSGYLLFYTDYNSSRDRGALKISEGGKSIMIADDVQMFTTLSGKRAAFLVVEGSSNTGELYSYDGSKNRKRIDSDVSYVAPVHQTGTGNRYWSWGYYGGY